MSHEDFRPKRRDNDATWWLESVSIVTFVCNTSITKPAIAAAENFRKLVPKRDVVCASRRQGMAHGPFCLSMSIAALLCSLTIEDVQPASCFSPPKLSGRAWNSEAVKPYDKADEDRTIMAQGIGRYTSLSSSKISPLPSYQSFLWPATPTRCISLQRLPFQIV